MEAISTINITGYTMAIPNPRHARVPQEPGIFVVRFRGDEADIRGVEVAAGLGRIHQTEDGYTVINRRQLEELRRLEVPYELLTPAPRDKRTPIVELSTEIDTFAIKFKTRKDEMIGVEAMAELGNVSQRADGLTLINGEQLAELNRIGVKYELLTTPPSGRVLRR
jgi:hypothetical protein